MFVLRMAGYELRKITSSLTDTERRIIETYVQRGGTAKEIASMLNVSERTVYKALYKYRKAALEMGIDPSNFYLRKTVASTMPGKPAVPLDAIELLRQQLVAEISRIVEESVQRTLRNILEELLLEEKVPLSLKGECSKSRAFQENQLEYAYTKLSETLEKLNSNIEKLAQKIDRLDSGRMLPHGNGWSKDSYAAEPSLPSFVQDNPWIEILSRTRVP